MKRSDKPFKMKRSPLKIFGAIAALLTKVGIKTLAGKAITTEMIKAGAGKLANKAATSVASNLAMNALKPKDQQKVQKTGAGNFANMQFGTGSSFAMKRNMKK